MFNLDFESKWKHRTETSRRVSRLAAYAVKRVTAGAHLPTPWLFEPVKRPDDRADYCLDCSFLPQWKHRALVLTLEWSGARSGEGSAQWAFQLTGPPSNTDYFFCLREKLSEFRTRDFDLEPYALPLRHTGSAYMKKAMKWYQYSSSKLDAKMMARIKNCNQNWL